MLIQLSRYSGNPLYAKLELGTWTEFFSLISEWIKTGVHTLYFEEVQWLAGYDSQFISELKYAWDNEFRHNSDLIMILCGSSPSFMINEVLHSKALYNRSQHEMPLQEFSLSETAQMLSRRSPREVLDAYLLVGGIPEYLKRLQSKSSVFLSLCEESFRKGGFFSHEYERIFTSSLAGNKNYKKIIAFLSLRKFASRSEIARHLKIGSGGTLTGLLDDLEVCQFITKYAPYNLGSDSLLTRYCLRDAYLRFYFKFIAPIEHQIDQGDFDTNPSSAIKTDTLNKWLGFSFERFCCQHNRLIAKILGFHGVRYRSGAYFSRTAEKSQPNFQFDLVFERDDKVVTVCEIKYLQSKVSTSVVTEFERKLALFLLSKTRTLHKVLIAPEGADSAVLRRGYFDQVITLNDL